MRTKVIFAVFLGAFFVFSLQARNLNGTGSFGITLSGIGVNTAYHVGSEPIGMAFGNYNGNGFFSIGAVYLRPIFQQMDFETGIEIARYNFRYNPVLGVGRRELGINMITIPFMLRYYFWRGVFVNGGLLLDFDLTDNIQLGNQSGFGATAGIGVHYDFRTLPIGLFVNPYLRQHSLILFSDHIYPARLLDAGLRLGLVYNFQ